MAIVGVIVPELSLPAIGIGSETPPTGALSSASKRQRLFSEPSIPAKTGTAIICSPELTPDPFNHPGRRDAEGGSVNAGPKSDSSPG